MKELKERLGLINAENRYFSKIEVEVIITKTISYSILVYQYDFTINMN